MDYLKQINQLIRSLEEQEKDTKMLLEEMIPGSLHSKKCKNAFQYYIHYLNTDRVYVHTKNTPILREQTIKMDLEALLADTRLTLDICRTLKEAIKQHPQVRKKIRKDPAFARLLTESLNLLKNTGTLFTDTEWQRMIDGNVDQQFRDLIHPEYRNLIGCGKAAADKDPNGRMARIRKKLTGIPEDSDPQVRAWMLEDYHKNPYRPQDLRYTTYDGEKMRSKLEVLTAELLKLLGIPYRYEMELRVGDEICYPDFTLMHPKTHKIIYLEIYGKMSDRNYRAKTALKQKNYILNGFIPGQNLLCYFESEEEPIDFSMMKLELEHKFL